VHRARAAVAAHLAVDDLHLEPPALLLVAVVDAGVIEVRSDYLVLILLIIRCREAEIFPLPVVEPVEKRIFRLRLSPFVVVLEQVGSVAVLCVRRLQPLVLCQQHGRLCLCIDAR
jgi:hypothetical protein